MPDARVLRLRVGPEVEEVRRALWNRVRERGLVAGQWGHTEIPGVADLPEVHRLGLAVRRALGETGPWVGPQVHLVLPEPDTAWQREARTWHVDHDPEGNLYKRVIGVAVTSARPAVTVRLPYAERALWLEPGQIVVWSGDTEHAGALNLTADPRIACYWRVP